MNITAHVAETIKSLKKKSNWKSKTSKLNKTIHTKTLTPNPLLMTEDDIEKLFGNHEKDTEGGGGRTKGSTEVPDSADYHDFVGSVKFLQMEDFSDRFLSGLRPFPEPQIPSNPQHCPIDDLTVQFKRNYLVGKVIGEGAYATVRVAIYKPKELKIALKIY
jgi:hypothetical protein